MSRHSLRRPIAAIRADLARLFILRKADIGLGGWSDEDIVDKTNDICAALMACGTNAVTHVIRCGWNGTPGPARRSSGCPPTGPRCRSTGSGIQVDP